MTDNEIETALRATLRESFQKKLEKRDEVDKTPHDARIIELMFQAIDEAPMKVGQFGAGLEIRESPSFQKVQALKKEHYKVVTFADACTTSAWMGWGE
jgi:hypothetical protein